MPDSADFVMFWWEKAALAARGWKPATEKARAKGTRRFGLITTNSLRQTFNRLARSGRALSEPRTMTIRKRIERLETKRGQGAAAGPSVVFLCGAETGEPLGALRIGGGSISREPGETREAFKARAMAGAPAAIHLPAKGREALATGKAPRWAQSELVMRALRQKHNYFHKWT